jgi:hypothetical protein
MKNRMKIKFACMFALMLATIIGALLPLAVRADGEELEFTPTPQQSPLDLPTETATTVTLEPTTMPEMPDTPAPTSTPKPVCAATVTEFEARQAMRWEAVAIIGASLALASGGLWWWARRRR